MNIDTKCKCYVDLNGSSSLNLDNINILSWYGRARKARATPRVL